MSLVDDVPRGSTRTLNYEAAPAHALTLEVADDGVLDAGLPTQRSEPPLSIEISFGSTTHRLGHDEAHLRGGQGFGCGACNAQ